MTLINDNHSREMQQVYSNFYQSLILQKLLVANWQWSEESPEQNTSQQDEYHQFQPTPITSTASTTSTIPKQVNAVEIPRKIIDKQKQETTQLSQQQLSNLEKPSPIEDELSPQVKEVAEKMAALDYLEIQSGLLEKVAPEIATELRKFRQENHGFFFEKIGNKLELAQREARRINEKRDCDHISIPTLKEAVRIVQGVVLAPVVRGVTLDPVEHSVLGSLDKLEAQLNNTQPNPNSLDKQGDFNSQPEPSKTLIFQASQHNQIIDELELNDQGIKSQKSTENSERLLAQIEVLQSLPEGTVIATAPSIRLDAIEKQGDKIVSEQTVLSTDEQGRIIKNTLSSSSQKKGTQVINEQLSFFQDSQVAQYLENLTEKTVNQKIHQNPELIAAQVQRQQQPNNPMFWQQWLAKGGNLVKDWWQQYQQKQTAKRLYYLFHQTTQRGQQRYSDNGYTIVRQPVGQQQRYTVLNSQAQPILTFDVNRKQRLSIIESQLTQDDYQALSRFGRSSTPTYQTNEILMRRANTLAAKLIEMAQTQQQSIRRAGEFYSLAVDPNGTVEIQALDGRGVIYHQTLQGNQPLATNLMSEADLIHFERQFQSQQQSSVAPVYTATPVRSHRRR